MGRSAPGAGITSQVRELRTAHGWSQSELARAAGLTRQAVNAVESARYIPNTAVSLRLARALGCTVEDLFSMDMGDDVSPVEFSEATPEGSRVTVGRIGGRYVAHTLDRSRAFAEGFAPADGLAGPGLSAAGRAVTLLLPPAQVERTAILPGCDPSLGLLAAHAGRRNDGVRVAWLQASSTEALRVLSNGEAHAAGSHLWDAAAGDYNVGQARSALGTGGGLLVCFAAWEQGLAVAPGNPKGIRGIEDLAREDVTIINRDQGAGARELLDRLLSLAGIPAGAIHGYESSAASHVSVARTVAAGGADAGMALRAVAGAYGLGFVPLAEVRFDLVVPAAHAGHPAVAGLLDTLNSGLFRAELRSLPGYETARTGETVFEMKAAA